MRVELCDVESVWDEHVHSFTHTETPFLHAWGWGEAQLAAGNPIARLLISDAHGVCAVMLCVAQRIFFDRRVVLSPRGPLCRAEVSVHDVLNTVLASAAFQAFVARTRAIAVRIEPEQSVAGNYTRIKDVEPAQTWMIPLSEYSEDSLWNALKQKTRYNIRLAQKHAVDVEYVHDEYTIERIVDIWKTLSAYTRERHGIEYHSMEYYTAVCTALRQAEMLEVAIACVRNTPVAINIGVRWGNTVTYLYGASDHTQRAIMAPSLLQWEMITRALRDGYAWYDFYGIAPEGVEHHPLAGVTRFKQGFVGVSRRYAGTYELPLRPVWYAIYQWTRTLRRFLRP